MMRVLLAGGTGLIGSALLRQLLAEQVTILLPVRQPERWRQANPALAADERITLLTYEQLFAASYPLDAFFCALGTTRAQAGKAGLLAVDYQLVADCAAFARQAGATMASVVSALGADARSPFFYNRVKGRMEQTLESLGFARLALWQPSLLLGERAQARWLETLSGAVLRWPLWGNLQAMPGERVAQAMVAQAFAAWSENPAQIRYRVADIRRLTT